MLPTATRQGIILTYPDKIFFLMEYKQDLVTKFTPLVILPPTSRLHKIIFDVNKIF